MSKCTVRATDQQNFAVHFYDMSRQLTQCQTHVEQRQTRICPLVVMVIPIRQCVGANYLYYGDYTKIQLPLAIALKFQPS